MIDDGAYPDRLSGESADDVVWADEQLLISEELFGAPPPDLAPDAPPLAPSGDPVFTLPEGIWGDTSGVIGGREPEFAEGESDEDWWLPGGQGDSVVGDPPAARTTPADRLPPPRPTLAPAPVTRSGGGFDVKQRLAAAALVIVAVVGLLLVLSARGQDAAPAASAPRQIDAAGVPPPSTLPATTLPAAPVTTSPAPAEPAPPTVDAPPTTSSPSPSPSPSSPVARTPATTAAPQAPARSNAAVASAEPPPTSPPAPTPTATVAPPTTAAPPTTVTTLPPEPEAAETTVTTKRTRTTVPSTTLPTVTSIPDQGGDTQAHARLSEN